MPGRWFTHVGHPCRRYAYLDGAKHVQVSLAMDAIMAGVSEKRDVNLAFLCSPTDAFTIQPEAAAAARA